jgi:hypothetical protein
MIDLYQLDGGWTLQALRAMNGDMFSALNMDPHWPQGWETNPINKIVKDDDLWSLLNQRMGNVSGVGLVRAQVICQQLMWQGKGPEGDKLPKTLRKLWYAGHKEALQHISRRMDVWRNGDQMNDVAANACQSTVYGELVGDVIDPSRPTYLDLYVKDGSRQFEVFDQWGRLPDPLSNMVVAIEKDAAYEDCVRIGRALGVAAAVSGGGKMGKAGTENMVRSALSRYYETPTPGDLVNEDSPCYVLVISDWDYDGEAVIAPTFVNQMRRYIPEHLLNWVRVGIKPEQVERLGHVPEDKWYQVKYHVNSAYSTWCKRNALFDVNGEVYQGEGEFEFVVSLAKYKSPTLGYALQDNGHDLDHSTLKKIFELVPPLGYELDALKRVEYADLIIEGLLTMVPWETLLDALSRKAWSEPEQVTDELVQEILYDNQDYIDLDRHITDLRTQFEELIAKLEGQKSQFEEHAHNTLFPLVEDWKEDERIAEDDPEPDVDDMAEHLRQVQVWNHWQPYSRHTRNSAHRRVVSEEEEETIRELKKEPIEFERVSF